MMQLRNAILVAATGDVLDHTDPYARAFWVHALAVGVASQWLSDRLGVGQPDECFISGMLHDIGKVVISRQAPEEYSRLIDEAALEGIRFYKHEKARLNFFTHETIGALVARKWELDTNVIETIRFHHEIEENGRVQAQECPIIALVSAANLMANRVGMGAEVRSSVDIEGFEAGEVIGLNPELIEECCEKLPELLEDHQAAIG